MQRNFYILIALAVGAVLLLLLLSGRERHVEMTMAAKSQSVRTDSSGLARTGLSRSATPAAASAESSVRGSRPLPAADHPDSAPDSAAESAPVPAARELLELNKYFASIQLTESSDLNRMYLMARRIDPGVLSAWISDRLHQQDLAPGARYNAIWIATRTNSPAMLPLWKGLLDRSLPATPGEEANWRGWMQEHRSENLRLMQVEQLRAVSMIGALQDSSPEAQDFLFNFASSGLDVPGDVVMLRLEAARAIHQHNRNGLLRLASALPDKDPLRDQLRDMAKIRRGEP